MSLRDSSSTPACAQGPERTADLAAPDLKGGADPELVHLIQPVTEGWCRPSLLAPPVQVFLAIATPYDCGHFSGVMFSTDSQVPVRSFIWLPPRRVTLWQACRVAALPRRQQLFVLRRVFSSKQPCTTAVAWRAAGLTSGNREVESRGLISGSLLLAGSLKTSNTNGSPRF